MLNRRSHWVPVAIFLGAIVACSDGPLGESSSAETQVRFDLGAASSGAVTQVCLEADEVNLIVSPESGSEQVQRKPVVSTGPTECSVTFKVTVKKGRVDFTGLVLGNERPLKAGEELNFPVEGDGFEVFIGLHDIDALNVETEVIGGGGPSMYPFTVDGEGPLGSEAFEVGANDDTTVAALAAGARVVALDPHPCVIDDETHEAVPTDSTVIGRSMFEIDCTGIPGGVLTVTTVTGNPDRSYSVSIDPETGNTIVDSIGPNDTRSFAVPAGEVDVELDTGLGPPICDVLDPNPTTVFMPSGGSAAVTFRVSCQPILREGGIRVITELSPAGSNPGGVVNIEIDGVVEASMGLRADIVIAPVLEGRRTVEVTNVPAGCIVRTPPGSMTNVQVFSGKTAGPVVFEFFCS